MRNKDSPIIESHKNARTFSRLENLFEILRLDTRSEIKHFKKGDILQREGELESSAFFVKEGLLRGYTIDDKGKEHVFIFAPEGWVINDFESLEDGQANRLIIDCIEDSTIVVTDNNAFVNSELTKEQLQNNLTLFSKRVGVLQKRVLMLMSSSAKTRYKNFLETYPDLPNRIPQKMIASYLGITAQALSTIRRNMAQK